jgi:hypothetical protein
MQNKRTEKRIGAMEPARNRTSDEPTFQQFLTKYGLLPRGASIADAWSLWQKVCENRTIVRMSQEIERDKWRISSVTAGYQHTEKVLAMLSTRQMTALKKRVGGSQT